MAGKRLLRVDHIGIAVRDLEESMALYTLLFGAAADHVEEVADQGVRTAFFKAGETDIELLSPTSPDSPVARFLAKRGPGIHHICFAVADIQANLRELAAQGVVLIDQRPRRGAHNKRIAFLHPGSTGGVLLELSEGAEGSTCTRTPPSPHAT
jgi:methylmalonyl-CoA epimerase